MSLNAVERRTTSEELLANLAASGRSIDHVATELDLDRAAVVAALHIAPESDPVDVWLLRDHLEAVVLDAGGTPVPFTVLTERSRRAAERWFPLRTASRRARAAR